MTDKVKKATDALENVTEKVENAAEKVGIITENDVNAAEKVGIYIHVPFCRSKCYYCDFCSKCGSDPATIDAYVEAACREIDAVAEKIRKARKNESAAENIRRGDVDTRVDICEENGRGDPAPTGYVCRGGVSPPVINGSKLQNSDGESGGAAENCGGAAENIRRGGVGTQVDTYEENGRGDPAPTGYVCRGGVSPPVINGLKLQKSDGESGGAAEKTGGAAENCPLPIADTVYFGGGTPTLLTVEQFERLISAVERNFGIAEGAEITAEANPKTADREKLAGMRKAGINRLSIGMQSTHDGELRALGRIHNFADFERIFADAREVGFDNISADLMYGIPNQTRESFAESVRRIAAMNPEHISSYCLTVEEGTNFYRRRDSLNLPDEDSVAEMYAEMSNILAENGYNKYEISNFSKIGRESRHNLKYWEYDDYIGIGPAAHSFFSGVRSSHSRDIEGYIAGEDIIDSCDRIEGDEALSEYVMLAMRLSRGVDAARFKARFGLDLYEKFGREFEKFAPKYLTVDSLGCRFSDEGMFISSYILSEVLDF